MFVTTQFSRKTIVLIVSSMRKDKGRFKLHMFSLCQATIKSCLACSVKKGFTLRKAVKPLGHNQTT